MPPFSAVVFDMDGTLFDTERLSAGIWLEVGRQWGDERPGREHDHYAGMNRAEICREMLRRYGPDFPAEDFLNHCATLSRQRVEEEGVPMKPGTREVLDLLRERGVPTALATSTYRETTLRRLELTGLSDRFQVVITGDQVKHSKPHPEIWLLACRELGVEPGSALAVEDSGNGVRSALAAGMPTVMIPDTCPPTPEMEERLYRRFRSLLELRDFLATLL